MNAIEASTVAPGGVTYAAPGTVPYLPSALNRLFNRIERLPGGGWWIYPVLYVVVVAYHHVALWLSGDAPVGSLALAGVAASAYGPYAMAATHYITRVAPRKLAEFRPASGLSDEGYALRYYELAHLPAGRLWVALAVGILVAAGTIFSASAAGLATFGGTRETALFVLGPPAVFGYGMLAAFVLVAIRQLRLVQQLHREATDIDLFDTAPIYAFSRLTVRIGMVFLIGDYYALLANGTFQADNEFALGVIVVSAGFAAACFALPLWGIHGRLAEAKASLVRGASQRAQALHEALYLKVDGADLTGVKDLSDGLGGLKAASERIEKLPTWPWPPQVLRGFISAILLPVVVFLITRLVGTQIH